MDQIFPLVSVLTTVKNGEDSIECTIKSVMKQNYSNVEYIIIDGGSIDNTVDIIKKTINGKIKFFNKLDKGVYYGMNYAISLAKGEIITLLNSGDFYFDSNVIEKVVDLYCKTSNKLTVFNGGIKLVDKNGEYLSNIIRTKATMSFKYFIMPINHPAFFVTREVYNKYGLFNTNFKVAADYELVLRLVKNNVIFCFSSEIFTVVKPPGISSYEGNNSALLKEAYSVRSLYINKLFNNFINILLYVYLILSKLKNELLNFIK
jgi:glycosyltransferase involved in cell wall biosynthesis